MSEDRRIVQHYYTDNPNSVPSPDALADAEIALNVAAENEKIFIKNTEGEIVTFRDDKFYQKTISEAVSTKQDTLVSGDNIKTINGESLLGGGEISIPDASKRIFIGTQEEYNEAKAKGKIEVGALVIILDDSENEDSTIALIGTAILGKMILGKS